MSNLDNLINKIVSDAEQEYNSILNDAKHNADNIINNKINKAEEETKIILEKGKVEAQNRKERIISNAQLEVRNQILSSKQELINKVYKEALNYLIKLPDDEFLNFIKNSIQKLSIEGDEELIVSYKDKVKITDEFIKELNKILIDMNKKGELKLSSEERDIKGGFILQKNGIEINNSFESLVDSCKDAMEREIVDILF